MKTKLFLLAAFLLISIAGFSQDKFEVKETPEASYTTYHPKNHENSLRNYQLRPSEMMTTEIILARFERHNNFFIERFIKYDPDYFIAKEELDSLMRISEDALKYEAPEIELEGWMTCPETWNN
jgi:hypothetical protein